MKSILDGEINSKENSKKIFLEQGKWLTNGSKIISAIIAIVANIVYFFIHKDIIALEKQQSLLLVCAFIVVVFLPIDFSIIVKNFIKHKLEE